MRMRRIILFIACSLDGYIARLDGGIDWLFSDADYGYSEFFAGIDTVVMGRKTYDLSLSFGEYPYPGRAAYVFSRERAGGRDAHAQFVGEPVGAFMRRLRQQPGRDIWLVGGGQLVREFLNEGLIDDFIVSVHPIVLGAGLPLFPAPSRDTPLRHIKTIPFASGLVQLHYQAVRA
jgi:dihydrofolate reductase